MFAVRVFTCVYGQQGGKSDCELLNDPLIFRVSCTMKRVVHMIGVG